MLHKKITPVLFCFLSSLPVFGQEINEATWSSGKVKYHSLAIIFNGDIEIFLNNIRKEFGREQVRTQSGVSSHFEFLKKQKEEWDSEKFDINVWIISNESRHIINVVCLTLNDQRDLLVPHTAAQRKIVEFISSSFKQ